MALLFIGSSITLLFMENKKAHVEDHIATLFGHSNSEGSAVGQGVIIATMAQIGNTLFRSGLVSLTNKNTLKRSLQKAGINDAGALPIFLGAKLLSALLAGCSSIFIISSLTSSRRNLVGATMIAFLLGMLLPDIFIAQKRRTYLEKLKLGLPDMLDMLVICAEAGLNLEASLERVGEELQLVQPEVSRELALTMSDIRIMSDRNRALNNLGRRTGLPSLERLSTTLVQALRFGTPIRQALRILATELREDALTSYETKAAKLPVLLTIPMILFILPSLFLVIMGPAAISLFHQFKG